MAHTKDNIRSEMNARRKEVSDRRRLYTGKAIAVQVTEGQIRLAMRAFRVGLYLSTQYEIPTRYIARAMWEASREVCVPAWNLLDMRYGLCELNPAMRLVTGKYGIREPAEQVQVMPWDVDSFVIPGLAFDRYGGRLGYGKGIYDDILTQANSTAVKIGICYDWQILDEPLPLEPHDRCVDWVVSDKRAINCKQMRADLAAKTEPRQEA